MDYKKIIKSRDVRNKILNCLWFIPDEIMIKIQYYIKTGRKLDLKNPQRFTEKLQWYKLYYKNPLMIQCVDKYDVRDYVVQKGLKSILNECYGVYDRVEDIDFEKLPNQFVLKNSLGVGGNSVIVCKNKNLLDFDKTKSLLQKWLDEKTVKSGGREWPYYCGKNHRIIVEKYIDSKPEDGGLIDYKFFCFNGRFEYLYIIADRDLGKKAGLGIFNREYEKLPVIRTDEDSLTRNIKKPVAYSEMIEIAEKLAAPFPEARIDLYYSDEKIIFGEITFWDGSGYMQFEPDDFDFILGRNFVLPEKRL